MRDVAIHAYFMENAPQIPGVTTRAINALVRGGINTMDELSAKSDVELAKVRNMGEKCLGLTIAMRTRYVSEDDAEK